MKKRNILKKKKDFEQVFKYGKGYKKDFLYLKVGNNNLDFARFGIIVNKKISNKAVERNRIKRRLREAIIARKDSIKKANDIIVVALPGIKGKKFNEIDRCIEEAFLRAGIL